MKYCKTCKKPIHVGSEDTCKDCIKKNVEEYSKESGILDSNLEVDKQHNMIDFSLESNRKNPLIKTALFFYIIFFNLKNKKKISLKILLKKRDKKTNLEEKKEPISENIENESAEVLDFDLEKKINSKKYEMTINRKTISILTLIIIVLPFCLFWGFSIGKNISSINKSNKYFAYHDYAQAYNELQGLTLTKEEDKLLDKQVKTVVKLQKYLDLYYSYISNDMNEQARDTLIVGLDKYEELKTDAEAVGVLDDFEYIKNQMLEELEKD